jgi:ABC-2 type transport system permease protein
MTAAVTPPVAPPAGSARPGYRPATFVDALRSEWTKFRTVRSSFWSLAVGAILGIGIGSLVSLISANHYRSDPTLQFDWNPADRSLGSLMLTQLAFAILGSLVVTGEYSTGMIRTSLAAVPKRSRMLAAKTLVFTAVVLVVGEGLFLTSLALLGLGFGVLLRHAAAAIGTVVAILLVLPPIALALPTSWSKPIEKYWPTNAGFRVATTGHGLERFAVNGNVMSAWTGFGVMLAFVAVVLVAAFYVLERRDA